MLIGGREAVNYNFSRWIKWDFARHWDGRLKPQQ